MPVILGFLLRYTEGDYAPLIGYTLTAIYILFAFGTALGTQVSNNNFQHGAVKARIAITALIYSKVLNAF